MPTFQPYGGLGWPLACLLPPSAISLFATVLLKLEGSQRGVRWSTINLSMTSQYPFSAATVLQMLALDVLIYGLLTWYLDQVRSCLYSQLLCAPSSVEQFPTRHKEVLLQMSVAYFAMVQCEDHQ